MKVQNIANIISQKKNPFCNQTLVPLKLSLYFLTILKFISIKINNLMNGLSELLIKKKLMHFDKILPLCLMRYLLILEPYLVKFTLWIKKLWVRRLDSLFKLDKQFTQLEFLFFLRIIIFLRNIKNMLIALK